MVNRIMRMWDSTTNGWATGTALEQASQGSSVIAALNELTPGVYYLRFSYDMNRVYENLKIGVKITGHNGGFYQSGRGNPGTTGVFSGLDSASGGVPCKDATRDNAFVKCAAEHEVNGKTNGAKYPWRIKIVPSEATPDDLNVFCQGSFTQLEISIWQTNQDGDGAYESNCYFDSLCGLCGWYSAWGWYGGAGWIHCHQCQRICCCQLHAGWRDNQFRSLRPRTDNFCDRSLRLRYSGIHLCGPSRF